MKTWFRAETLPGMRINKIGMVIKILLLFSADSNRADIVFVASPANSQGDRIHLAGPWTRESQSLYRKTQDSTNLPVPLPVEPLDMSFVYLRVYTAP